MTHIKYQDYSKVFHGSNGITIFEIRRNGTVWACDDGELEFDARTDGVYEDFAEFGWGNGGPAQLWEWFEDHPEEAEYQYYDYTVAVGHQPNPYWKPNTQLGRFHDLSEEDKRAFRDEWMTPEALDWEKRLTEWEATPDVNKPGYNLWEHIHGDEADARIQYWLHQVPADGTFTLDLTADVPTIEHHNGMTEEERRDV